jgi:methyl-accepting chemotaxis protein
MSEKKTASFGGWRTETISDERRAHLQKLHEPLQQKLFLFAGPASVALYGLGAWMTPIWQNLVMFGAVLALFAAWFAALQLTKRGRLEASVYTFMASVMLFEGIEMMMMDGNEATELLACFAVIAYGALYTRRFLYVSAVGLAVLMMASELVKNLHPYPIYTVPVADRLMAQIPFTVIIMWLVVYILRRGLTISETMYDEVQAKSRSQSDVIRAATRIQPVIDKVAAQLKQIAEGFVSQSSEHAATTNEVSVTMGHIMTSAGESATAAGRTKDIAARTREDSVRSRDRLLAVQRGFGEVTKAIESSLSSINELSRQAENIEEILGYNRELGEHIKVLAVNAAIEAATAGEYGRGFRVVAEELREMIVKTDANLKRSSQLLGTILSQAKENATSTQGSAEALAHYYEELQATGELIDSITESFVVTSGQVGRIAEAAQAQVVGIDQVRVALTQIDSAAGQLEVAARTLVDGVNEIVTSHEDLRSVLASDAATAARGG